MPFNLIFASITILFICFISLPRSNANILDTDVISQIINNKSINFKVHLSFKVYNNLEFSVTYENIYDGSAVIYQKAIKSCSSLASSIQISASECCILLITAFQNQFIKKYETIKIISNYLSLCNNYQLLDTNNRYLYEESILLQLPSEPLISINQEYCKYLVQYHKLVVVNTADYNEIMDLINYNSYLTINNQSKHFYHIQPNENIISYQTYDIANFEPVQVISEDKYVMKLYFYLYG